LAQFSYAVLHVTQKHYSQRNADIMSQRHCAADPYNIPYHKSCLSPM